MLPPLDEEQVDSLPRHEISEAEAIANSSAASPITAPDATTFAEAGDTVTADSSAEDEDPGFMSAGDRQRELELLAQDMELLFLTKAGE